MRLHEPDWRGVAAVLAILGVFAVLVIGAVYAGRNPTYTISTEEISTVSTVLGAAIGAVAGYMGSGRRPPRDPPPELRADCAHYPLASVRGSGVGLAGEARPDPNPP